MRFLASFGLAFCCAFSTHAATITVGPGGNFTTLAAAVTAAAPNDEIGIFAGTYTNMFAVVDKPLTIFGLGGTPVLQSTGLIPNGKAFLIVRSDLTVRNLEFRDARVSSNNGAGIRLEVGDLTVEDSIFRNNQMGILTNDDANGDVLVTGSSFIGNGAATGANIGHAIYANFVDNVIVRDSIFSNHIKGHDIKSRAQHTTIVNNTLDDGVGGTASYAIDLPNGGDGIIVGNRIDQGPNTGNTIMINYGSDATIIPDGSLLVQYNTLASTLSSGGIGVRNYTTVHADLVDNVFQGLPTKLLGLGAIITQFPEHTVVDFPFDPGPSAVPSPAPLAVLLLGCAGILCARWRSGAARQSA
jgi:hypothetical protein